MWIRGVGGSGKVDKVFLAFEALSMHIWTKTMTCKNPAGRPGCAQPPRYVAGAENPGTRRWSDRCKAQS